jgi:Cu(I)/Ag(I) efflux system membrane fusion protein/cobalt-zinc-cadmium efflux system membrane fusion protein
MMSDSDKMESHEMMRIKLFRNTTNHGFLVFAFLIMAIFLVACGGDESQQASSGDRQLYTCGMHPQVIQEGPGNCPICGMKLTPLKAETENAASSQQSEAGQTTMGQDTGKAAGDDPKGKKILYWRAPMDPTYISNEPGKSPMGMDLVPVYEGEEPGAGAAITIDPVTVQNMGVRTKVVKRQPFYRVIRTVGHIDYDEEKLYNVNIKFSGWIEKLYVAETGEPVRKGDPLFEIYSPDLVATQEEYILAYNNQNRLSGRI